ncbi:DinB family protein [soil metagenome]
MLHAFTRLKDLLATIPAKLAAISDEDASVKISSIKWSKKEIMGHLIDSASNNHQRFVRLQIEDHVKLPKYRQNEWVAVQHWQDKEWTAIIALWQLYNEHIAYIFEKIDTTKLFHLVTLGETDFTLQFIIDDYADHLEHHLKQVFEG